MSFPVSGESRSIQERLRDPGKFEERATYVHVSAEEFAKRLERRRKTREERRKSYQVLGLSNLPADLLGSSPTDEPVDVSVRIPRRSIAKKLGTPRAHQYMPRGRIRRRCRGGNTSDYPGLFSGCFCLQLFSLWLCLWCLNFHRGVAADFSYTLHTSTYTLHTSYIHVTYFYIHLT